jgi:hypothetical protein
MTSLGRDHDTNALALVDVAGDLVAAHASGDAQREHEAHHRRCATTVLAPACLAARAFVRGGEPRRERADSRVRRWAVAPAPARAETRVHGLVAAIGTVRERCLQAPLVGGRQGAGGGGREHGVDGGGREHVTPS